jgi:hypothetical protein
MINHLEITAAMKEAARIYSNKERIGEDDWEHTSSGIWQLRKDEI